MPIQVFSHLHGYHAHTLLSILISRSSHGYTRFHFDTECRSFFRLTFLSFPFFPFFSFLTSESTMPASFREQDPVLRNQFVECGHGVPYAVAAHPEPASPCRTIPCNPSPGGTSHVSYTTSGSYLHRGPTYPRYPYPTDHCRDWVICVPRYRTLGSVASPLGSEPCLPG